MMRTVSLTALAAGIATAATPGMAQDVETPDAAVVDNIIIVTAQKRAERIEDVPITISALSGENLEQIGVDEFDEVAAYIPGLIVQEQSANNPGFVIRGITSDSGSAQIAPRVSIYYNGIDVSRSRGSYFDLFDIDRIEVVKGPQATLFGTAATIGAISVITNKPEPGFDAAAAIAYGNFDAVEFDGMVNAGNDRIAARLAGTYKKRDGYIRNIAGEPGTASAAIVGIDQDDLNGFEQYGVRGSIRLFPDDDSTIDLIVTYEQQDNPGSAFKSGTIPPTGGDTSPFTFAELGGSPFSESALGLRELGLEREVWDVNVAFQTGFGDGFGLTSVSGWREFDSLEVFDADGSALFFLEFAEDAQGQQISHETRVSYEGPRFRGFAGFNLFHEEGTQRVPFSTDEGTYIACAPFAAFAPVRSILSGALGGADPCVGEDGALNAAQATAILTQGAATVLPYESVFANGGTNSSYSVFADGTAVLGNLELTAGIRYVIEERRSTYFADQPGSAIFASIGVPGVSLLGANDTAGRTLQASDDFDAFLPRFNALYRLTPDANLYATISKGRRAPVLNLTAAGNGQPSLTLVEAEQVWNYEGGFKAAFGAFSAAVGVFYQDYSNFQTSFVTEEDSVDANGNPIPAGTIVPVNAGQATNFGVEVETAFAPTANLRFFANYAYIDASIDEPADQGTTQFVGSTFRLTPEHSASGGFDLTVPLGNGSTALFLTPSVTYQSRVFFEVPNDPAISEDGYALVNLRAGVSFADGRFSLTGFARNLLDEEYLIDAGNTGGVFGTPTFIAGEPRLYGIELSARY